MVMSSVIKVERNMNKGVKVVMHVTMAIPGGVSMVNSVTKMNTNMTNQMKVVMHVIMVMQGHTSSMS